MNLIKAVHQRFIGLSKKDLCEAKHDLGVRKMCSKTTLCPHYTTLWGGGAGKV